MKTKILVFLATFAFFFPASALASTAVSGAITSDTVWTSANSPYLVGNDFAVETGATLTILPGVIIKFEPRAVPEVRGRILARGTAEDPIIFTSSRDDTEGGDTNEDGNATLPQSRFGWRMDFDNPVESSVFEHTNFFYLSDNLSFFSTAGEFSDTEFSDSFSGIWTDRGHLSLSNVSFRNITEEAILLSGGSELLANNLSIENTGDASILVFESSANIDRLHADHLYDSVIEVFNGSAVRMTHATIRDTGDAAIELYGSTFTLEDSLISASLSTGIELYDSSFPVSAPSSLFLLRSGIEDSFDTGIKSFDSSFSITDSSIKNNGGGIEVFGRDRSDPTYDVVNSSIEGNIDGISAFPQGVALGTMLIRAKNNWWGDSSGPYHLAQNPDGMGDTASDFVDFIPWLASDPTVASSLTLAVPTETEDDGNQDAKGVADKTVFTFSVMATGTPDTINLIAVSETGTTTLPLTRTTLVNYVATSTFPKGHYAWHIEATKGTDTARTADQVFTTGYSNVAFLPGIKASRLFKQGTGFEDQLWEPNWSTDTEDIALNPDGGSADTDIYTKTDPNDGLIDQANILPLPGILRENFYASFIESMDKMVKDKEIAKWKALPYDWRLAFPQILTGGNATVSGKIFYDDRYATNTPYILQEIRSLAKDSDTGKVTIVAHSMGGLLAKKLLHDYADMASSTDTLILVDSPQLGTPQAIATMLHGTNEDIPVNDFGLFTNAKTGRKVAQNMPSVYTLLPSREYAARVTDENQTYSTLISQDATLRGIAGDSFFSANSVLDYYNLHYGTTTITTYNALKDFLGGKDGHLSAPDDDIIHPTRIQMDMLAEAQAIHDEIDHWTPPAGMRAVQIAGWGIPETIRGINYKGKEVSAPCPPPFTGSCKKTIFDTEPMFTFDGDGTVVAPSQTAMNTETYFVDLNGYNNSLGNSDVNLKKNRSHGSVLEVDSVRLLVENIFKNKTNPAQALTFIKTDKNQLRQGDLKKLVRLSLHSPVKIDIADQDGNHLGISASSTAIKTVYDTQMSNSYYLEMGEGKYVGFPLSGTTTIQLQGIGAGTFTLNLEQYQGDTREETQTFTDIPVSTTTRATLVINTLSDAKELALDQNGDGVIDSIVFTDEKKETITFQTLKDEIQTLPEKTNKELLKKAVSAEKQFSKGNYKSAKKKLTKLKKEIAELAEEKRKKKPQIENMETLRISAILDVLIAQTETKIQENKHENEGKKKDGGKEDEDDD